MTDILNEEYESMEMSHIEKEAKIKASHSGEKRDFKKDNEEVFASTKLTAGKKVRSHNQSKDRIRNRNRIIRAKRKFEAEQAGRITEAIQQLQVSCASK